jgi:hypothetical protein
MPARRFPPPWSVEDIDAAFVVKHGSGQKVAYVYYEEEPGRLLNRFRPFNRTGWRFFGVFLPWKRSVGRLDPARYIDGKRKRILTPSNIFLHLNIGDPASLFVANKI